MGALHYAAPFVIFFYFVVASVISLCSLPEDNVKSSLIAGNTIPRPVILLTMLMVMVTYVS